ncbi:hypothetical protein D3C71_908440 [compost metagenome]
MNRIGKAFCQRQVRRGSFTPHQVGVRRISQTTADGLLNPRMGTIEPFAGALASDEFAIIRIAIRGNQIRRIRISTGDNQRRHTQHIRRQTRGNQLLDRFLRRDQHFTAHMTAFLHGRQLIFKVNCRCTGFNHGFHQLKGIQHAAKARFGIGHDRQEIIHEARIVRFDSGRPLDLIRTAEGVVDPIHHRRHRVSRIKRLVRIHTGRQVGVSCHLPAGQINRFDTRFRLLQRLTTGQGTEAVDVSFFRFTMQQTPHFRRTKLRQRAFRVDRTTQFHHFLCAVRAVDAFPARLSPLFL